MRIGIDGRTIFTNPTGIGSYTRNLIKNLAEIDRENEYFVYFDRKKELRDLNKFSNFHQKGLHFPIFWTQMRIPLELRKDNVDLYQGSNSIPLVHICRTVVTIYDLAFELFPQYFPIKSLLFYKCIVPTAARKADKIITLSYSTKNDLVNFYKIPPSKIEVIYCSVDHFFKPINESVTLQKVLKKYNITQQYILFVGALQPRKNIQKLIEAYVMLKENQKISHKLVIVGGTGWYYSEIFKLKEKFKLKDEVVFTGYVPGADLPFLYNGAELFVYPSLYEGFGIPPLEAMACGTPVITSNTSSLPEVVSDAAVVINPYDVEELAQAMGRILKDNELKKILRKKGLRRAKFFSWRKSAQKTLAVFKETLDKCRG